MNKKSSLGATFASILSAILAFLGVVTCCGMPIVAGILAFLGIGASQLAFFAEYRGVFMLIAVISLIFGFWQVYFRKKSSSCCAPKTESKSSCCEPTPAPSCCGTENQTSAKPKHGLFQQIFLWIATIVVLIMLFWGQPNASETTDEPAPSCCSAQDTTETISSCCPQPIIKDTVSSCCPK